jgi:ketosteroid isomerase-like protein
MSKVAQFVSGSLLKLGSVCLFFTLPSIAVTIPSSLDGSAQEVYRKTEKVVQAYLTADIRAIEELLAPDYIFVNHQGLHLQSRAEDIEELKSGKVRYTKMLMKDLTVRVWGDTAFVAGLVDLGWERSGKATEEKVAFTKTWARNKGRWRLVGEHMTPLQPESQRH